MNMTIPPLQRHHNGCSCLFLCQNESNGLEISVSELVTVNNLTQTQHQDIQQVYW